MSNFLCGRILFRSEKSTVEQGELGFIIQRIALERGFSIILGANISQDIILQIIGTKTKALQPGELLFQFTDNPVMDVAEDLLDNPSSETLQQIADWVRDVGKISGIAAIVLYFSEGLDDHYNVVEVRPETFSSAVRSLYGEEERVPSVAFRFDFNIPGTL